MKKYWKKWDESKFKQKDSRLTISLAYRILKKVTLTRLCKECLLSYLIITKLI